MSELDDEKRFYERFFALHRDPQLLSVCEKFGIGAFRRSSVLEGLDEFLRTHDVRGHTCVEIGTLKGLTAIVLARYFERVITIDIKDDPLKYEIADFLGVRNVEFINVRNNAEKAEVINAVVFDCAFVDGDHARDTDTDLALVERCGQVLFHEHWQPQPTVLRAVSRLNGAVVTDGKWALWRT